MAKTSPNWEAIKQEYLESLGKIPLKDLADKHGVKATTLRSRKMRDDWDAELHGVATQRKNVATRKKRNTSSRRQQDYITEEEIDNSELTEKQRLFCLYFVRLKNATQAAINAGYSPHSASEIGYENLRKPQIRAEINRLRKRVSNELFIDAMDILEQYAKIAFADITDFVEFGQEEVPLVGKSGSVISKDPETGEETPVTIVTNVVKFRDSSMVDGQLISEVKKGRDGASIKLMDKMKALEKLEKYLDVIPDRWKRQIEEEKLKIAKMRAPGAELLNNVNIIVELKGDAE